MSFTSFRLDFARRPTEGYRRGGGLFEALELARQPCPSLVEANVRRTIAELDEAG